jgi:hypothetical protein
VLASYAKNPQSIEFASTDLRADLEASAKIKGKEESEESSEAIIRPGPHTS